MFDLYWSLLPQAESETMARISAYVRHCADHGIEDGPAADAARDGLPLRVDSGVAIIPIMGPMMRRAGPVGRAFGIAGTDARGWRLNRRLPILTSSGSCCASTPPADRCPALNSLATLSRRRRSQ
jgi:hypothetical protein